MAERNVYRVIFHNRGQVYEIFAKAVRQGELFGFIEIEGLLFGQRTQVVVDPSEEQLKTEFAGVAKFSIPLHSVIRVDRVEKQGTSRITSAGKGEGAVMPFPAPFPTTPPRGE